MLKNMISIKQNNGSEFERLKIMVSKMNEEINELKNKVKELEKRINEKEPSIAPLTPKSPEEIYKCECFPEDTIDDFHKAMANLNKMEN